MTGYIWAGMSRAEHKALCDYVRQSANRLELRDWAFIISKLPTVDSENGGDVAAEIRVTAGRKYARFLVSPHWATFAKDEKRHYVAHELIHCHFEELRRITEETIPIMVGRVGWGALQQPLHFAEERAVDAIADIAMLVMEPYPYPPIVKAKRKRK